MMKSLGCAAIFGVPRLALASTVVTVFFHSGRTEARIIKY